jgi:peptide/nickel transport system substrate-binding protein
MAVLAALSLMAVACGGGDDNEGDGEDLGGDVQKGGVYRIATDAYEWNASLDPTGEYLGSAWAIYTNMMLRNLVTYNHTAGEAGNEIVPDLATDLGEVSDDGLTYTFTLKDGIEFGPPVNREITAEDIVYAFKRIGTDSIVAQYGFYYDGIIEGLADVKKLTDELPGVEAVDEKTVQFTLTQPVGDFLYRLAMPAAAPIPAEVADCFTQAGEYGRYVIASGPYMYQGSEELDISSCDTMKPISGFDPNQFVKLERNPNYNADTDSPEVREANVDRWELTLNTNTQDIFDKIEAGELEGEIASPPAQVLRKYSQDEELKQHLHAESGDRTWYLSMNLTQPPFDDINVRKAVNFATNKAGLQQAWGGPIRGEIATHILPDIMVPGLLEDYDPYPSENFEGDVEAAKEAMRASEYDSDGDGVCDGPSCSGLLHISRNTPPWTQMVPIIEENLKSIGIEIETRQLEDSYTAIQTTARNVPINSNAGWGKDYADPSTFMVLFDSRSILPEGNVNYSLVGATAQQNTEQKLGLTGNLDGIPNVDADIDACVEVEDDDERLQCWADLDKKIMEEVVPWVPYLDATNVDITGPAVTQYDYDQFSGEAAWSKVAVDPSQQSGEGL